ncbi:hypothetical protein RCL1_008734 [Eukaryota sp. TZLM3-RCL]
MTSCPVILTVVSAFSVVTITALSYILFKKIRSESFDLTTTELPFNSSQLKEEWKAVLCLRKDLAMGKGKMAAQAGHAAVSLVERLNSTYPQCVELYNQGGHAKVALQIHSEAEALELRSKAHELGLITCAIRDAGRTQLEPNSLTVVGVLGPKSVVDQVTGHLKLL